MNLNNLMAAANIHAEAMSSMVAIYVPGTNGDAIADNTETVERVASLFSDYYGGASAAPVNGYYNMSDGSLAREKSTRVYSYCTPEAFEKHFADVLNICALIKTNLSQECIGLELNHGGESRMLYI